METRVILKELLLRCVSLITICHSCLSVVCNEAYSCNKQLSNTNITCIQEAKSLVMGLPRVRWFYGIFGR